MPLLLNLLSLFASFTIVNTVSFEYYPIGKRSVNVIYTERNTNCPAVSQLQLMFNISSTVLPSDHGGSSSYCCKFQDQVVTENLKNSKVDHNEYSVMYGQFLWSHDTAKSPNHASEEVILTCNGNNVSMPAFRRNSDGHVENDVTACMSCVARNCSRYGCIWCIWIICSRHPGVGW